jgi:hypothetical protein
MRITSLYFVSMLLIMPAIVNGASRSIFTELKTKNMLNALGKNILKQAQEKHFSTQDTIHSLLMGTVEKFKSGAQYPDTIRTLNGNNNWSSRLKIRTPSPEHNDYRKYLIEVITAPTPTATPAPAPAAATAEPANEQKQQNQSLTSKIVTYGGAGLAGIATLRLLYCMLKTKRKRAASWLAIKKLLSPAAREQIKAMPLSDQRTISMAQRRLLLNILGVSIGGGMMLGGRYV